MAFSLGGRSSTSQETQNQYPPQTELIKHILTPAQTRYLVRREDLERWLEARFGQRPDLGLHVRLDTLCLAHRYVRSFEGSRMQNYLGGAPF